MADPHPWPAPTGRSFDHCPDGLSPRRSGHRKPSGHRHPEDLALAMAKAIARRAVLDWEGVGDDVGQPLPVTPEGIDALLEIWPIFEAFQTRYVAKGLILDAEKNVSAPLPSGPSAGATATARPAPGSAPTAQPD